MKNFISSVLDKWREEMLHDPTFKIKLNHPTLL